MRQPIVTAGVDKEIRLPRCFPKGLQTAGKVLFGLTVQFLALSRASITTTAVGKLSHVAWTLGAMIHLAKSSQASPVSLASPSSQWEIHEEAIRSDSNDTHAGS